MSEYSVTLRVANPLISGSPIPHAFVALEASGKEPLIIGFYPQQKALVYAGTVKNDGISHEVSTNDEDIGRIEHPYDWSRTFEVSGEQYLSMLKFAEQAANNPGEYQLLGESDRTNWISMPGYQCTGFARDILQEWAIVVHGDAVNNRNDILGESI